MGKLLLSLSDENHYLHLESVEEDVCVNSRGDNFQDSLNTKLKIDYFLYCTNFKFEA